MIWTRSYRADPASRLIADRHYNRQSIGSAQFVPPGRCLVLRADTPTGPALWVTSWPFAEYVKHQWAGAWVCSLFRNESDERASDLITQAVAATRAEFGDPPAKGMITFIDQAHVAPVKRRGKDLWGYSYRKAGFWPCGETLGGLLAFRLRPGRMPDAAPAMRLQGDLFEGAAA